MINYKIFYKQLVNYIDRQGATLINQSFIDFSKLRSFMVLKINLFINNKLCNLTNGALVELCI